MKTGSVITGMAAGMAIAAAAITVMYPDVYRRMMRDSKRAIKNGKKFVNKLG